MHSPQLHAYAFCHLPPTTPSRHAVQSRLKVSRTDAYVAPTFDPYRISCVECLNTRNSATKHVYKGIDAIDREERETHLAFVSPHTLHFSTKPCLSALKPATPAACGNRLCYVTLKSTLTCSTLSVRCRASANSLILADLCGSGSTLKARPSRDSVLCLGCATGATVTLRTGFGACSP